MKDGAVGAGLVVLRPEIVEGAELRRPADRGRSEERPHAPMRPEMRTRGGRVSTLRPRSGVRGVAA